MSEKPIEPILNVFGLSGFDVCFINNEINNIKLLNSQEKKFTFPDVRCINTVWKIAESALQIFNIWNKRIL